jgi:hypothetical protein
MREALQPFKGANRLNYLCVVVSELLGLESLSVMPALLTGFASVTSSLHPDVARAIHALRVSGFAPSTMREMRLVVDAYLNHHAGRDAQAEVERDGFPQFYEIDKDFKIRRRWSTVTPEPITLAVASLCADPRIRMREPTALQDVWLGASINRKNSDYRGDIQSLGFTVQDPPMYDLGRVQSAPGMVLWSELIAIADEFDAMDVEAARQQSGQRRWFHRLHDKEGVPTAQLLQAHPTGLAHAQGIDLTGIKHLIGLPGAGKTTLLYMVAAWIARRDLKACFLFPSIEVAVAFLETLQTYGVRTGLLSGQSEGSRARHVANFAMGLSKNARGFAISSPAARFFATNCALAGFASEEEEAFPHEKPPCMDVSQRIAANAKPQNRRCALSAVCARMYPERELIEANIWAGHVLSLDRTVANVYSDFDSRHFEFVARTFDLLVVDECDGAQADLDDRGTPIMKLFGDEEALWATLINELHGPVARGRNAFVSGKEMPSLIEMTGRFGQATNRLSACIQHLSEMVRKTYDSKLLTSLSIIADMFPYEGDEEDEEERQEHFRARQGMERLWDAAIKLVAFRPSIKDDAEEEVNLARDIPEIADVLAMTEADVTQVYRDLHDALQSWDRDPDAQAAQKIADIFGKVGNIRTPLDPVSFLDACALLTTVSMVVLQHMGLAPHLRLLNSLNLVSDSVFESRPSKDQLGLLPEALTGKLSGIRYTASDEGNVNVTHVGVQGTPRRLFERMHALRSHAQEGGSAARMAVLLCSATSLLKQSPRFHINEGPHYVLKRPNAGQGWGDSRYAFTPVADPYQAGKFLRFSGAKFSSRDRALQAMVDGLLTGGPLSRVSVAIASNDVLGGVKRRAGFVVNSYDQCRALYEYIQSTYTEWRGKLRFLRRAGGQGSETDAVTANDVESLGDDASWDILIFPMSAIGRGVNIVFRTGPRANQAMIGSLYFLTRPHPRQDDLGLIQGLVGRASESFDKQRFANMQHSFEELRAQRKVAVDQVKQLLRLPLVSSRLGSYARPFVADQMIIILQTIGRTMRGDRPAFVYFVDAAWAPASAHGMVDTERTSMLVMMRSILNECLSDPDPVARACYENLYTSFSVPLGHIENLITS